MELISALGDAKRDAQAIKHCLWPGRVSHGSKSSMASRPGAHPNDERLDVSRVAVRLGVELSVCTSYVYHLFISYVYMHSYIIICPS